MLFLVFGLFLYVAPSGTKSWRWKYRFQNKEKLLSLGQYPLVSLIFRYAIATGRAEHDSAADLRGALAPLREYEN